MKLFYREYGDGEPIIIVHGLFGMSDNWISVAKALASDFKVYVPDMRNHGKSPYSPIHTYDAMSEDLSEFIKNRRIEKASFIGHSMGGKTVLQFAENHLEKVASLVVIDISPKQYFPNAGFFKKALNHKVLLETMQKINLKEAKNRAELTKLLQTNFKNIFLLQLVLKNIYRDKNKQFRWKINIEALRKHLSEMRREIKLTEAVKSIKTLFIFGENSPYFEINDKIFIHARFPKAKIKIINGAGHLIHIEKENDLIKTISNFIKL